MSLSWTFNLAFLAFSRSFFSFLQDSSVRTNNRTSSVVKKKFPCVYLSWYSGKDPCLSCGRPRFNSLPGSQLLYHQPKLGPVKEGWGTSGVELIALFTATKNPTNKGFFHVVQAPHHYAADEPLCSPPQHGSKFPCGTSRDHPKLQFSHQNCSQKISYYKNMCKICRSHHRYSLIH